MTRLGPRTAVLAATLLAAIACSDAPPPTQVMVSVDGEPGVRMDTRSVVVTVYGGARGTAVPSTLSQSLPFAQLAMGDWPRIVALAPLARDATRVYRVVATAYDGPGGQGAVVAEVSAISGYVNEQVLWLRLVLQDSCRGVVCTSATETCAAGRCGSATRPVIELPRWGTDAGAVDAGAPDTAVADAGVVDARSVDSGRMDAESEDAGAELDASPASDAAPFDASVVLDAPGRDAGDGSRPLDAPRSDARDSSFTTSDQGVDPCDFISCDDGVECTTDSCFGGSCIYEPRTGSCDDGDPCTTGDYCTAGSCVAGSACPGCPGCGAGGCSFDWECGVADRCTTPSCVLGVCTSDQMLCDDGLACTTESCDPRFGCIYKGVCIDDGGVSIPNRMSGPPIET